MATPSDHLLRTFAAVPPATRVLDAGCGAGRHFAPLLLLGFDAYGCDTDAEAVAAAARHAQEQTGRDPQDRLAVQDAARLAYADDHFGWVVACGLLDGYSDAEQMAILAELRRVLAPGGWLYVTWSGETGALAQLFTRAGFAVAEAPQDDAQEGIVRAIFRRVEADTVV